MAATGHDLMAADSRVRDLVIEGGFDVDPGRAGHEPDQDPARAEPVWRSPAMTAERMRVVGR